MKRATDKPKNEYTDSICDEIMAFQRTGRHDLLYMKTKELGGKESRGIQDIGIEDCRGNTIADQRQVMKLRENCFTELYDRSNRPEYVKVEPKEEIDADDKGPCILHSEVER